MTLFVSLFHDTDARFIQIVSGLESFFLAMTIHPEIQKKAQQEVDSVCLGRLPDFSDYDSMPYVRALVKEILRWNPIVPLSTYISSW